MAATVGRTDTSVIDLLREESFRFDFFQAVRVLLRAAEEKEESRGGSRIGGVPHVGEEGPPSAEAVRFEAVQSLSFAASDVAALRPEQGHSPPTLMVEFMGLTGTNGVLPFHYTKLILDRIQQKDPAMRVFLDLFNHRTISFFYRAWEKHRFPIAYERVARRVRRQGGSSKNHQSDLFTQMLYSLVGLGSKSLRNRQDVDDEVALFYAGHFSRYQPRSASVLEDILNDFFEVPIRLEQFQGRWLYLEPESRTQLSSLASEEEGARLGFNFVAGTRVWDSESTFRLRVGPLHYERFAGFFPGGKNLRQLSELVRLFVGPQFDFEVQPILKKEEVPPFQIGSKTDCKLHAGWNLWLGSSPRPADADQAIFQASR